MYIRKNCLTLVPDDLKIQEMTDKMCARAVEKNPGCLKYVPGHFKTEKMCIQAIDP